MKTPFMSEYQQVRKNDIDDEMDAIRRSKMAHKKTYLEHLETAFKIAEESLKRVEAIVVSDHAIEFMLDWLEENEMPKEWYIPDSSQIGYWIELESPFADQVAPFDIKAFQFVQVAKNGLDLLDIQVPEDYRESLEEHHQELTWVLEAISSSAKSEFSMVCLPGLSRWAYKDEHLCPFGSCEDKHRKQGTVCKKCREAGHAVMILASAILAAKRGEFQNVEYHESVPGERGQISQINKNVPDVLVSRIDIRHRTSYVKGANHSDEPRAYWKESHSEEDVETVQKAARQHTRRYKDGREVEVKQSKPRKYWRLRSERVIVLD